MNAIRFCYKKKRNVVLKEFLNRNWVYGSLLIDKDSINSNWLFHDESWDHIINRWDYRARLMSGESISLIDVPQNISEEVVLKGEDIVEINCKNSSPDEWIYLYLNYLKNKWTNYSLKFSINFGTLFKEFQVDFRHVDLFNRYRYRFQDGKIYFDIVYKGEFISSLNEVTFRLKTNIDYQIEVKVMDDVFQIWINDELISTDFGNEKLDSGPIAIILWEDNGKNDMNVKMHSFSFRELLIK